VNGAVGGETLESSVSLRLAGGGYLFWELASGGMPVQSYRALAAADLETADAQEVTVLAVSGTVPMLSIRGISRGFRAFAPLELTLPPAFTSAKLEVAAATPNLRPRLSFEPYSGARFYQMHVDTVSGTAQRGWLVIFSADWLGTATSYDFPDFSAARGFDSKWAFQPADTLQIESDAVRSSRGFLPSISSEVKNLAGSQLEFANNVSLFRAP
jgi:hypothetical protein